MKHMRVIAMQVCLVALACMVVGCQPFCPCPPHPEAMAVRIVPFDGMGSVCPEDQYVLPIQLFLISDGSFDGGKGELTDASLQAVLEKPQRYWAYDHVFTGCCLELTVNDAPTMQYAALERALMRLARLRSSKVPLQVILRSQGFRRAVQ